METTAAAVLSRTAECAALLAIGYQLRASRLFSATDAEVGPAAAHCNPGGLAAAATAPDLYSPSLRYIPQAFHSRAMVALKSSEHP